MTISFRRYGITHRSHFQGSRFLSLYTGTDRLSRNVCKKLPTTRCVIIKKSAVLFYLPAEALNHALFHIYLYIRSDIDVYRTAHVTYHGVRKTMVVFGTLRLVIHMLHYIMSQRKGRRFLWLTVLFLRLYVSRDNRMPLLKNITLVFFYFVLWQTNAQLFHKLWHSYMFRHYRVILKELSIFRCDFPVVFQ